MHIIVLADGDSKEEFMSKKITADAKISYVESISEMMWNGMDLNSADAFFLLKEGIYNQDHTIFKGKPVFINAVTHTARELGFPQNFFRINGWPGFLNREIWEISPGKDIVKIFEKLEWKYLSVADEPGLVSARIISMIINEAFFALGENVSSKDEIDIAMRLGTNYPYGPFEWCKKIGLQKVYDLLHKLNETHSRYSIAPAMKNELIKS